MKLHSTSAVAAQLDRDRSTIHRMAVRLNIGTLVGAARVFTDADIAALAKNLRDPGNPNFVAGNHFGKPPKKTRKKPKK